MLGRVNKRQLFQVPSDYAKGNVTPTCTCPAYNNQTHRNTQRQEEKASEDKLEGLSLKPGEFSRETLKVLVSEPNE